jgi:hypothetical protein
MALAGKAAGKEMNRRRMHRPRRRYSRERKVLKV